MEVDAWNREGRNGERGTGGEWVGYGGMDIWIWARIYIPRSMNEWTDGGGRAVLCYSAEI